MSNITFVKGQTKNRIKQHVDVIMMFADSIFRDLGEFLTASGVLQMT